MTKRAKRFSMSFSEAEFRRMQKELTYARVCWAEGTPANRELAAMVGRVDRALARYDSLRLHAEREEAAK